VFQGIYPKSKNEELNTILEYCMRLNERVPHFWGHLNSEILPSKKSHEDNDTDIDHHTS